MDRSLALGSQQTSSPRVQTFIPSLLLPPSSFLLPPPSFFHPSPHPTSDASLQRIKVPVTHSKCAACCDVMIQTQHAFAWVTGEVHFRTLLYADHVGDHWHGRAGQQLALQFVTSQCKSVLAGRTYHLSSGSCPTNWRPTGWPTAAFLPLPSS
ncbi:hypothetical protein K474DRAFT_1707797 [Panus rudis PR-1116 ss-1]|nr:hypothetical protein K474DRAFT_1707797 [Panus rudis PR-1116 ss-1]